MSSISYNQSSVDSLKQYLNSAISKLESEDYLSNIDLSYWDEKDSYVSSCCRNINSQIMGIISRISSSLASTISNESSYNSSTSNIESEISGLTSSVSISGSSSSGYSSSGLSSSTSSSASSGESVSIASEGAKSMSEIDIDSLILGLLAPFGVTKDNLGEITESDEYDYIVTMKNPNGDGTWKADQIKAYYIKDNQVVAVMMGDGTFGKVEDGSIVIEKGSVDTTSSMFVTGVGLAGSYLSKSTNYNTERNKEIFKKFFPNSTDEDFNNFCDSIETKGKDYINVVEDVLNKNKDKASEIIKALGENNLVIDGNGIKIDSKAIATELYAQQASKSGVDFSSAIKSDVVFSESTKTDIINYLNENYNLNISTDLTENIGNNITENVASNNETLKSVASQ